MDILSILSNINVHPHRRMSRFMSSPRSFFAFVSLYSLVFVRVLHLCLWHSCVFVFLALSLAYLVCHVDRFSFIIILPSRVLCAVSRDSSLDSLNMSRLSISPSSVSSGSFILIIISFMSLHLVLFMHCLSSRTVSICHLHTSFLTPFLLSLFLASLFLLCLVFFSFRSVAVVIVIVVIIRLWWLAVVSSLSFLSWPCFLCHQDHYLHSSAGIVSSSSRIFCL